MWVVAGHGETQEPGGAATAKGKEGSGLKTRGLFKWLIIQRHGTGRPRTVEEDRGNTLHFTAPHPLCFADAFSYRLGARPSTIEKTTAPFMAMALLRRWSGTEGTASLNYANAGLKMEGFEVEIRLPHCSQKRWQPVRRIPLRLS